MLVREHKQHIRYTSKDRVEAVNPRIRANITRPKTKLAKKQLQHAEPPAPTSLRRVSLLGSWQKVLVYNRENLFPGAGSKGPCIIEEYDSTTIIGRNWRWKIDPYQDLDLTLHPSAKEIGRAHV